MRLYFRFDGLQASDARMRTVHGIQVPRNYTCYTDISAGKGKGTRNITNLHYCIALSESQVKFKINRCPA